MLKVLAEITILPLLLFGCFTYGYWKGDFAKRFHDQKGRKHEKHNQPVAGNGSRPEQLIGSCNLDIVVAVRVPRQRVPKLWALTVRSS